MYQQTHCFLVLLVCPITYLPLWNDDVGQSSTSLLRRFFLVFLILVTCKNKAMSASLDRSFTNHVISFTILEQSRVIHSFVFAGQAGRVRCIVICITCNQPHIFVDSTLKSQALQFACWAPFAIKWTAIAFSSDHSKFLHSWLSFWQTQTLSKVKTFSAEFTQTSWFHIFYIL